MLEPIENKDLVSEIDIFLRSSEPVLFGKKFEHIYKIHNPFGFINSGDIHEVEKIDSNLIKGLNWKEFCEQFDLELNVKDDTSINDIRKKFDVKYLNTEFDNFYWASGSLSLKQTHIILELLKLHYKIDNINSYYSYLTNLSSVEPRDEIYFIKTDILDILIDQKKSFSPNVWWSENLDWFIYTDYDLSSSYLYSIKQIDDILDFDKSLEVYKIDEKDLETDFKRNVLS